mmetsp:Transcript_9515/g.16678  ORF Transcript_9515/g.16678 Transcript_9515/m.16678 type:complete len:482 (+) Transcript_9515:257-1702(+)
MAEVGEMEVPRRRSSRRSSSSSSSSSLKKQGKRLSSKKYTVGAMQTLDEEQEEELDRRIAFEKRGSTRFAVPGSHGKLAANPFQTDESFPQEEIPGFVLRALFLVPIRVLLMFIITMTNSLIMVLSVIGQDPLKPLPDHIVDFQNKVTTIIGRCNAFVAGLHVKVEGERCTIKEAKMVVVGPHSTYMDPTVVGYVGGGSGVAKSELGSIPLFGSGMVASQTLLVHREDKNSRTTVAKALKDRISLKSAWRRQMALFPEGTCTNRTSLIAFRLGAFEPGAPVQPIALKWDYKGQYDHCWTSGSPNRMLSMIRSLAAWRHDVTVVFLPVYTPNEDEKANPVLFANNVRTLIAKELNVPVSDFSYSDMFLAKVCAKSGMKQALVLPFAFESLLKDFQGRGIDVQKDALFSATKSTLSRFCKTKGLSKKGHMTKSQFNSCAPKVAKDLKLIGPLEWDEVEENTRSDGTITFHTFLLAHLEAKFNR